MASPKVHHWSATLALCSVAAVLFILLFPPINLWPLAELRLRVIELSSSVFPYGA